MFEPGGNVSARLYGEITLNNHAGEMKPASHCQEDANCACCRPEVIPRNLDAGSGWCVCVRACVQRLGACSHGMEALFSPEAQPA